MVHAQYMRYRTHRMPLLSTWWYSWWSLHQHLVESHSVRLLVNRFDSNILISEHVFKAPSQTYSSKSLLISSEQAARNFSRFIIIDIKHHFIARTGVKQHPFYNIPTGIDNHGGTPPPKESSLAFITTLPRCLFSVCSLVTCSIWAFMRSIICFTCSPFAILVSTCSAVVNPCQWLLSYLSIHQSTMQRHSIYQPPTIRGRRIFKRAKVIWGIANSWGLNFWYGGWLFWNSHCSSETFPHE